MTIQYKQLKEIEKELLKGISIKKLEDEFNTITGVYTATTGINIICVAVTIDYKTKEKIETEFKIVVEELPYNPNFIPFREGPVIIETLKSLKIEPELIIVAGYGTINKYKLGVASYVGLMLKKPTISVSIKLNYGIIKNNDVYFKEEIRGKILKTKEFANPIFISPGHNIDINTSLDITKEISTGVKLPIPLFLAHKKIIKLRDEINNKI